MNRKWLVGGVVGALALAAILALIVGGEVGRSIVPEPEPTRPSTIRFTDTLTDVSIAYPATWVRRAPTDQAVRLIASASDESASLSVSVRKSGLEPVTESSIAVVRPLTDDLLEADDRITSIGEPEAVKVGALPGLRYRYTYRKAGGGGGAHDHYFLFKRQRLIQIVLQAVPAAQLATLQPTFDRIASSFRGTRP